MPPPFRSFSGKFSPGVNLSPGDLRRYLTYEGHCILGPQDLRLPAERLPEIAFLFQGKSKPRPGLRTILWAIKHKALPLGRLKPTCGTKGCLNPDHQEDIMPISDDLCQRFFEEASARAEVGEPLLLRCSDERAATRYRFRLHKWRKENSGALPPEWNTLTLRIITRQDGVFLTAELVDQEEFASALEEALGPAAERPSAEELLKGILGEGGNGD